MDDATPERWLPVPGYPNYTVSDRGRVYSLPRLDARGHNLRGRWLKDTLVNGYTHFALIAPDGKAKVFKGHQLVLLAFVGPCPPGMEIRHLDGSRNNNRLSNLAYGTRSENVLDRVAHGTHHWANKTHCPEGHEYTPENTYIAPGSTNRRCRICAAAAERRYRERTPRCRRQGKTLVPKALLLGLSSWSTLSSGLYGLA